MLNYTITDLITGSADVIFSYEVEFRWSEVRWASRWNVYLEMSDLNIHWFSVINSIIVVFFLAGQFHL